DGAKVKFNFERFLSVAQKELSVQKVSFENLSDDSVEVKVISSLDANVENEDANYDERFWQVLEITDDSIIAETKPNDFGTPRFTYGMQVGYVTELKETNHEVGKLETSKTFVADLKAHEVGTIEKRVVVVTSRDYETVDDLRDAMEGIAA